LTFKNPPWGGVMNRYILENMEKISVCFHRKTSKNDTMERMLSIANHFELLFAVTNTSAH